MTDKKKRVGILISGRGSNMVSLIAAAHDPAFKAAEENRPCRAARFLTCSNRVP